MSDEYSYFDPSPQECAELAVKQAMQEELSLDRLLVLLFGDNPDEQSFAE